MTALRTQLTDAEKEKWLMSKGVNKGKQTVYTVNVTTEYDDTDLDKSNSLYKQGLESFLSSLSDRGVFAGLWPGASVLTAFFQRP